MKALRTVALLFLIGVASLRGASPAPLDFENLQDGEAITSQFAGVAFTNAAALTSGITLNEFEFPPHSGSKALVDDGGVLTIRFSAPVTSFGGYFTYSVPLTLTAYDLGNNAVGSVRSAFGANMALSGDSGSAPNEFLAIASVGGIAMITITGAPEGSSFALDDVALDFDSTAPVTTSSVDDPTGPTGWNSRDVTVTLQAADAGPGTGVKEIVVSASGAQTIPSTAFAGSSVSVRIGAEGETTVTYFSRDCAGNAESAHTLVVRLDKTAPATGFTVDSPASSAGWYNRDITLRFNAADGAGIGVQEVVLASAGAQAFPTTIAAGQATSVTIAAEGETTITYFARDLLGNAEAPKTVSLKLDKTAPEVFNQWDPATFDVQMFGRDTVSGTPAEALTPVSVVRRDWEDDDSEVGPTKRGELRTYRLSDQAGNTTTVVELVHPHHGDDPRTRDKTHAVRARLVSIQYGTASVLALPPNRERFAWEFRADGSLNNLVQRERWGGQANLHEVVARWNQRRNETVLRTLAPLPESETAVPGLVFLRMQTDKGQLAISELRESITC